MADAKATIASLYEVTRQIGSGGGGIIYLGRHLRLDKDVVLKADKRPLSDGAMASLKREAETLKNLSHEYIPQIYDFVAENGVVYTVMDYIEGESLDVALDRGETFSPCQIVRWAKQALEALAYLHGRPPYGILHSDIKPANLMLTPEGDIRLIDFNVALALGEGGAVSVGRSQGYASPEHYGVGYHSGPSCRGTKRRHSKIAEVLDMETAMPQPEGLTEPPPPSGAPEPPRTGDKPEPPKHGGAPVQPQTAGKPGPPRPEGSPGPSQPEGSLEPSQPEGSPEPPPPNGAPGPSQQSSGLGPSQSGGAPAKTVVLDARSDIYGLGATLYHLLAGRRPARDAADVVPLDSLGCPPGLAAIINKSMSPDRGSRYQTADDMLAAFEQIHKKDPRSRRHLRFLAATAAALASILAIGSMTAFTGLRRMEWDNRADSHVEASRNALLEGDRTGALQLALDAVPAAIDLFTPPASAAAEKALADALGVYDLSEGFRPHRTIRLRSAPLMAELSPDGDTAAIVYAYEAAVVDLESGRTMFVAPMARSPLAEARFLGETALACAGLDGLCAYDVASGDLIWDTGSPATALAVAAGGSAVAAVNLGEGFATLHGAEDGRILAKVDFGGRGLRVTADNDIWNPRDNLLALSADGRYLAASFSDGSLSVFEAIATNGEMAMELMNWAPPSGSGYVRYEGGFCGELLAFSATGDGWSEFAVFDVASLRSGNPEPFVSADFAPRFGARADENGILVSWHRAVARIDPARGEPHEFAWAESDVVCFDVGGGHALVAMEGSVAIFDEGGRQISRIARGMPTDIALISGGTGGAGGAYGAAGAVGASGAYGASGAGGYALLGGRDSFDLTVLRAGRQSDAQLFAFDPAYRYHEARVSADGSRFMLFSVDGFRLYGVGVGADGSVGADGADDGIDGAGGSSFLIHEQAIPDPGMVRDQQYCKASGNLAVMYDDALTIYSGRDGSVVFEEAGLRSVFYAPYGASILGEDGRLRLVDLDTGAVLESEAVDEGETFAAYCGVVADSALLGGRKLIGAAKTADGQYHFAASEGASVAVYGGDGKRRFAIAAPGEAEAFFTETAVVISPRHGTPAAYSLKNGRKAADLEKDAYLTYIAEVGGHVVSQYLSTDGAQFGVLLDSEWRPVASLPWLCDTWDGQLVFCFPQGALRKSSIRAMVELVDQASAELAVR